MSKREILFRGKRTDNGEWVEGYYAKSGHDFILLDNMLACGYFEMFEVDQETVCQYTELVDKNGRKIFEGDVLEFTNSDFGKSNYIVFWNQIEWGIRSDLGNDDDLRFWDSSEWEVIGNIFDNPELIP